MEGHLHHTAGTAAEEADLVLVPAVVPAAAAAAGLAPATQDPDLAAVPTPGPGPALVPTARAHEAGPAPGQRLLTELTVKGNAPASLVPSPKIKIGRAMVLGES